MPFQSALPRLDISNAPGASAGGGVPETGLLSPLVNTEGVSEKVRIEAGCVLYLFVGRMDGRLDGWTAGRSKQTIRQTVKNGVMN